MLPLLLLATAGLQEVDPPLARVPLVLAGDLPIVEVGLGDTTASLVVDSGIRTSVLSPDFLARAIGVRLEGDVRLDLHLGPLALTDVPARVEDGTARTGAATDGLLALTALADHLVTVDFAARELVVEAGELPAGAPGVVDAFVCDDTAPALTIQLGEWLFDAHVDTGSPMPFALHASHEEKLPLAGEPGTVGRARTEDDELFEVRSTALDGRARIGDLHFDRPTLWFSEAFEHARVGPATLLDFAVTFDQRNQRIRLVRRSDVADARLTRAAATPPLTDGSPPPGAAALRDAFEADRGRTRLLVILSPT